MSSRPTKRARILSSEDDDSEDTDHQLEGVSAKFAEQLRRRRKTLHIAMNMAPAGSTRRATRQSLFADEQSTHKPEETYLITNRNGQPSGGARGRRGTSSISAATAQDSHKPSIRLTVKAPPSRLREVITNSSNTSSTREKLGRNSKRAAIIDKSDSEGDEDEVGEEEDEDDLEEEEEDEEDQDEDEEDEEDDEDEDEEIEKPSVPASKIKLNVPSTTRKPSPGRVLKQNSPTKSVEEKEMEDVSSDEDLSSEPEDDVEGDEEEDEGDGMEDEEMDMDDNAANETINSTMIGEDELDSQDEDSESGTPDPTKLTRRQRGDADSDLMALSNEAQKKKFFTAEQITMRRAEMARRRKDLSDKRNQNEKEDTLRRLLHKPAPKRRSRAQMLADAEREEFGTPGVEGEDIKASKLFIRTVVSKDGTTMSIPEEWLGTPAGKMFENAKKDAGGSTDSTPRLIQVIE